MRAHFSTSVILFVSLLFLGCGPKTEILETAPISDYLPLQVGKYRTYRLDSTVYTGFGRTEETHYYEEKQMVDALITDNLDRPSYRIIRLIRDTSGTSAWTTTGAFFITPLEKSAEVIENNLRTIRLALPIREGFSWLGNNYLPIFPYNKDYSFSSTDNTQLNDWAFKYASMGETILLRGRSIPNVITVTHIDEEYQTNNNLDGKTFSMDRYAKGIGLVYQELIMWEQQPNSGGSPYKTGFGVRRSLMDYN